MKYRVRYSDAECWFVESQELDMPGRILVLDGPFLRWRLKSAIRELERRYRLFRELNGN